MVKDRTGVVGFLFEGVYRRYKATASGLDPEGKADIPHPCIIFNPVAVDGYEVMVSVSGLESAHNGGQTPRTVQPN